MDNTILCCQDRMREYDALILKIRKALKEAPAGALRITKSHGTEQYYRRGEEKKSDWQYIRKENRELARALAQKEYDRKMLAVLEKKQSQFRQLMEHVDSGNLEAVYEGLSEARKRLVTPWVLSDAEYAKRWERIPYEGKRFSENFPEIYTEKGERVRSKSEKLIADKLYMLGIPYRYECPMKLKGIGIVYPDFTILKKSEKREIIWEHFGMMDDPEYSEKAVRKINAYMKNGICQGQQLLVTFETSHIPIDMMAVQPLLEQIK